MVADTATIDPTEYVRENRDELTEVIRHGQDEFTRALAIVVTTKYGDDPSIAEVRAELEAAEREIE